VSRVSRVSRQQPYSRVSSTLHHGVSTSCRVLDKYGYVDILVNNAGTYGPMSLDKGPNKGQGPLDGDPAEWDRLMSVNLLVSCGTCIMGPIYINCAPDGCIQIPLLHRSAGADASHTLAVPCDEGSWRGRAVQNAAFEWAALFLTPVDLSKEQPYPPLQGFIINIASIEALSPYPSAPAYASSKCAAMRTCILHSRSFLVRWQSKLTCAHWCARGGWRHAVQVGLPRLVQVGVGVAEGGQRVLDDHQPCADRYTHDSVRFELVLASIA
jgi:NAD(P)-dependent dehydrogenase (short-subunit alcohol dehydrogenase family)